MTQRSAFDCMFVPTIGCRDRRHRPRGQRRAARFCRTCCKAIFPARFTPSIRSTRAFCGLHCYKSIGALPEKVDLAVIVTPAPTVPGVIGECIEAGVRAAVVISAGFKERGAEGAQLEQQIQEQLRRGARRGTNMRVIGPNCLGIMNPLAGLNATFAHDMALPGNVAFLSQSGALETAILDWSLEERVGFSAMVSTGSMLDVGWGDLIDYFGSDPDTHSILLYVESVGDARSFLSAAREVALRKPIIVIKAGRSEAASQARQVRTPARLPGATKYSTRRCAAAACCASTPSATFSTWRKLWRASRARAARG